MSESAVVETAQQAVPPPSEKAVVKSSSRSMPSAATSSARSASHLFDLEIPVTVSFGERELALSELAKLGPGAVLELDRAATSPVDLLVHGRCVARGELVVVDEQLAVRLTEVLSTGERIRSLREGVS